MWITTSKLTQLHNAWLVEMEHIWHPMPDDPEPKQPLVRHLAFVKREEAVRWISEQLEFLSPENEEKESAIFERLKLEMDEGTNPPL